MASGAEQRADTRVLCRQDFDVDQQPGQWRQYRYTKIGKPFMPSRREPQMPGGIFANLWTCDDIKSQCEVVRVSYQWTKHT
jgi:hypothetical protein